MKMMNQVEKFGSKLNQKTTALVVSASAFVATNAYAGALADTVKTETADFKADLYAVGGIAIGLAMVGVGVGMVISMMRRGSR